MQRSFATTPSLCIKNGADYALSKGIIIADTKFEFGLDENGNIVIGDEMLTPDSSRFWPADGYEPGMVSHLLTNSSRATGSKPTMETTTGLCRRKS